MSPAQRADPARRDYTSHGMIFFLEPWRTQNGLGQSRVRMKPGPSAFELIPYRPNSRASVFAKRNTPAFDAL
jgi:hypothetical protein